MLETTSPLNEINDSDISRMSLLFNTPPADLTRPALEEIVMICRGLRGRKISAETSELKVKAPRAPKVSKTSGEFEADEDAGF